MNDKPQDVANQMLEHALDAALRRDFSAPTLPAGFQERLRAAIARSAGTDHAALRRELEHERRETLAAMQAGFVRLRRQTLVTMLLAAFVAGAALIGAVPLLVARFGSQTPLLLAGGAALLVLIVGISYALRDGWQPVPARWLRWLP